MRTSLRVVIACVALAATSATAEARVPGPRLEPSAKALRAALDCPKRAGAGKAVLLVHGTTSNPDVAWSEGLQPLLRKRGDVVCTVTLPEVATGPIGIAAEYVVASVRTMAARYHRRVSLVGHSQGGMVLRWAIKWWPDVRSLVGDVVGISPSNHGSPLVASICGAPCAAAAWQQAPGSRFLAALNRGDDTPGRVSYSVVYSTTDTTVPPPSPVLRGDADDSNTAVQAICPGREVSHTGMLADAVSLGLVLDALTHRGPARAARVSKDICDQTVAEGIDPAAAAQKELEGNTVTANAFATAKRLSAEPPVPAYATRPAPSPRAVLHLRRHRVGTTLRLRFRALGADRGQRWPLPRARIVAGGKRTTTDEHGRAVLRLKRPGARLHVRLVASGLEPLDRRAPSAPAMASSASSGCGTALPAGDRTVTLRSDGRSRPFLLHVPKGYTGRSPRPLLLNLHGTLSNGLQQMAVSGLGDYADRDGFLVAAPDGGAVAGGGHSWVVPGTKPRGDAPAGGFPDDVQYLRDVVRAVQSRTCQNRAKVFVAGYSAGGRMASAMACDAADVVTGVVANVGLRAGAPRTDAAGVPEPDPKTCAPVRPLPVIALHGTGDGVNPYDGGGTPDWQYSVPQAVTRWADLLGCRATATVETYSSKIDTITHPGCKGYSTITLYRVDDGGHRWFGGDPSTNAALSVLGPDPQQIKTSDVVEAEIKRYAMRAPTVRRLRATCHNGRVRVRVRAKTDSPLRRLTVRVGRKHRTTTKASLKRTFRSVQARVRVRARVIDLAGQTTRRTRTLTGC